ncbi:MAG TPA: allantoate amidohydrolase [Micromonosporaceae bacterium]|nr:allantoate amidohydrolase [Micromonosporaceae bacterium]
MITAERFAALWRSLLPIGRYAASDPGAGHSRYSWSPADLACREWFLEEALDRGLSVETDGNGNLYAWWGNPAGSAAVLTGSHLDSVPHGGSYAGALGVVGALLAIDELRDRGHDTPPRPVGIVVFTEGEGARFGVPRLGSRLLTGAQDADPARRLRDRDGVDLAEAMTAGGAEPAALGPDPERLARISTFVELHIEQGQALAQLGAPVGIASGTWAHGRWRIDVTGKGNSASTTRMADRHDPLLTLACTVLAADEEARLRGGHATVGGLTVTPNASNVVAAAATAWLDARAPDEATLDDLTDAVRKRAQERAGADGTSLGWCADSRSGAVTFDPTLRARVAALLPGAPVLATAAGHDAGVLAAHAPTTMLFVRNPSGVSHAPAEYATDEDCAAGVTALATVLESLAWP